MATSDSDSTSPASSSSESGSTMGGARRRRGRALSIDKTKGGVDTTTTIIPTSRPNEGVHDAALRSANDNASVEVRVQALKPLIELIAQYVVAQLNSNNDNRPQH